MSIHTPVVCPDCRGEPYREGKKPWVVKPEPCDFCGGKGWVTALDIEIERHERNGRGSRL